jgi:peptide/nickel transport system substrate-binding protein
MCGLLALVFGSSAGTSPSTTGRTGGTLRVVLPSGVIPTLDPAVTAQALGWGALWYPTCATLTAFRDAPAPEGYTVRPEAAIGLPAISRDRRTYVFTVRQGLRFSDGSRLTAANFAYALGRVLNPAMRSEGAALFSDVKRVSARGPRLRIELSNPGADLLTRLALAYACPVPLGFPVDPAGVPLIGVGSGPYYVASYETGRLLVLERNRYYRGSRPHRVDRVVVTIGGDFGANIRAVEEGQADVAGGALPFELSESLARRYGVNRSQLFRIRGTVVYFLALNSSRPLFRGNVALRKAVNLALNRTEIVRVAPGPLSHLPTDQVVPRWVPEWVDYNIFRLAEPNLKRARKLAAGNLRGGRAVLYASQVPFLVDQARVIAHELSQIGLEVAVRPVAPAVLDARVGTPGEPYDMVLTRYFVQYPDPADVMIRLLDGENARKPTGNTNFAYFDSPRYNRKMAAADRLTNSSARFHAFSKLDAEIMRDAAPWAPLYEGSQWLFFSKRVGCVKLHPVFRMDDAAVCLR